MKKILQFLINIIRRKFIYALDVKVIYKHKVHKQLLLLNDGDLNPLEIFTFASSVRNGTYFGFYKKQLKIQYNKMDDTILIRNENNIPITNNGSLLRNIPSYYSYIHVIYNNGILPLCDLNETIVFLDLENKCLLKDTYKFNLPFQRVAEVLLAAGMELIMTTLKIKGKLITCIYTRRIPTEPHKAFDFPYIDEIFYLSIDKEIIATNLIASILMHFNITLDTISKLDRAHNLFDKKFNKEYNYNTFLKDLLNVEFNPIKYSTWEWDNQNS